jgi:hypothetical protein
MLSDSPSTVRDANQRRTEIHSSVLELSATIIWQRRSHADNCTLELIRLLCLAVSRIHNSAYR